MGQYGSDSAIGLFIYVFIYFSFDGCMPWLEKAASDHLFPTSHSEMSHLYLELGHSEDIYTMRISKGYRSGLSWKWEE